MRAAISIVVAWCASLAALVVPACAGSVDVDVASGCGGTAAESPACTCATRIDPATCDSLASVDLVARCAVKIPGSRPEVWAAGCACAGVDWPPVGGWFVSELSCDGAPVELMCIDA